MYTVDLPFQFWSSVFLTGNQTILDPWVDIACNRGDKPFVFHEDSEHVVDPFETYGRKEVAEFVREIIWQRASDMLEAELSWIAAFDHAVYKGHFFDVEHPDKTGGALVIYFPVKLVWGIELMITLGGRETMELAGYIRHALGERC